MNPTKEILELYESILTKKSFINEMDFVTLNKSNYSNVKFDKDETQYDKVNKALLVDLQKAAKNANVTVTITVAKSGHNRLTKDNDVSRHSTNTAVDIGMIDGVKANNEQFETLGDRLKNELVKLGYSWNVEKGYPKAVLWKTYKGGNHYNHLHVSNNSEVYDKEDGDDDYYVSKNEPLPSDKAIKVNDKKEDKKVGDFEPLINLFKTIMNKV